MERIILVLIVIFYFTVSVEAGDDDYEVKELQWEPKIIQVDVEKNDTIVFDSTFIKKSSATLNGSNNLKFNMGETFKYKVSWGGITGGYATIKVDEEIHEVWNRKCYKIMTFARNANAISWIYKVRDTNIAYIDKKSHVPWIFEKHLNEGSYNSDRKMFFDHFNGSALFKEKLYDIAPYTSDIISSFLKVRGMPLNPPSSLYIHVLDDDNYYKLKVKVLKKEIVRTPYENTKSIKVEPLLESEGIFRNEGKLKVWFTDDKRRLPILMKSKVMIGHVNVKLISYDPGK